LNRVFVKLVIGAIASVVSLSNAARADLVITTTGSAGTQLITFDEDLTNVVNGPYTGAGVDGAGTGTQAGEGRLDSDSWAFTGLSEADVGFGGSDITGAYARGPASGAVATGGLYGFDVDNSGSVNRALGFQPFINPGGNPDDFNPGTVTLRVLNSTSSAITQWSISYDIFHFLEGTDSSSIDFSWAVGTGTPGGFTSEALDFDSPATTGSVWSTATNRSIVLNTPAVAVGSNLFLRWTIDTLASSNNEEGDQLALDNISVTAVPEPAAFLFGGLVCGVLGLTAIGRRLFGTAKLPTVSK
jgi:hypothetical protein